MIILLFDFVTKKQKFSVKEVDHFPFSCSVHCCAVVNFQMI